MNGAGRQTPRAGAVQRENGLPRVTVQGVGVNEQAPQPQDSPSSCLSLLRSPLLRSKGVPTGQLTFFLEGRASQAGADPARSANLAQASPCP